MLIWSVIKVLGNIELSFNAVWGIKTPRTIIKKFTEYIAIMLIAPIFIALSSAITIFISAAVNDVATQHDMFSLLGPAVRILLEATPYIIVWLLFAFIYIVIPNTKVKFKHAFIAGIIAGTSFNLLEWVYFSFQIGAAQSNAIYGSFAALPLFLVWVQSSWIIVLFGCEIAFSSQNVHRFIYEKEVNDISVNHKRKISLLILLHMNTEFNNGKKALNVDQLCGITKLPIRLIRNVITELIKAKIITEVVTQDNTPSYQPARNLDNVKLSELNNLIDSSGSNEVPIGNETESAIISKVTTDLQNAVMKSEADITLREIEQKISS